MKWGCPKLCVGAMESVSNDGSFEPTHDFVRASFIPFLAHLKVRPRTKTVRGRCTRLSLWKKKFEKKIFNIKICNKANHKKSFVYLL